MTDQSVIVGKIYHSFTPHVDPISREVVWKGATTARVAIAVRKVGNDIQYGMTVCSETENFCRKLGRELAEDRLINGGQGSGSFTIPPKLLAMFYAEKMDDHDISIYMLQNMIDSMTSNKIRKLQRKIGEERLARKVKMVQQISAPKEAFRD